MERIVFITGAAGGIGVELAKAFAVHGDRVIISDTDSTKIDKAVDDLKKESLQVQGRLLDVTQEAAVQQLFSEIVQQYGRLDVLVNNAGLQYVSAIEDFPTAQFELMIKVMLVAPFLAIKHAFPIMKQQQWGRIINMASVNGLVGFAGKAAYNSAKHGVIGLTKVAALEAALSGITVNAICPGYTDTPLVRNQLADLARTRNLPEERILEELLLPLVPQKRLLQPDEIAATALFLASDAAKGITGQAVVIDGGYTAQ